MPPHEAADEPTDSAGDLDAPTGAAGSAGPPTDSAGDGDAPARDLAESADPPKHSAGDGDAPPADRFEPFDSFDDVDDIDDPEPLEDLGEPEDPDARVRRAKLRERILAARQRIVPHTPEATPTRRRRVWLLTFYVLRRWLIEDRCAGMAAQLTMQTLLSTVPFFGVALLIVGLMDPVSGNALLEDLFRSLVPETQRANQLAHNAMQLAAGVNVSNLGAWGFLVSLAIAFVLFSTLERTFNRIWRITRSRSLLVKFTMFYTLATLGPALMLYSLAEPLIAGVTRMVALPVLTTSFGLVLLNRYMPHTAVRWGPAITGGLVTAVLIELAKVLFGYYAAGFALRTYEGLYGSLAIFPIIIVWSYISWMVVLLGAEIAFVVQRRRTIALQGYLNRYVAERIEVPNDSGRTAARLLLAICDRFSRRGAGLSPEALGERFRLPLDRVGELLMQLERHGFIVDTDTDFEGQSFVPARPLDQLKLLDVLALFEHEQSHRPRKDRLGQVYGRLDDARLRIVGSLSYADLVGQPRK